MGLFYNNNSKLPNAKLPRFNMVQTAASSEGIQFAVQRLPQCEPKHRKEKYYVTAKLLS